MVGSRLWLTALTICFGFSSHIFADDPPKLTPQQQQDIAKQVHELIDRVVDRIEIGDRIRGDEIAERKARELIESMRNELKTKPLSPTQITILVELDSATGRETKIILQDLSSSFPSNWDPNSKVINLRFDRTTSLTEAVETLLHEGDHLRRFNLGDPSVVNRFKESLRDANGVWRNHHLEALDEIQAVANSNGGDIVKAMDHLTNEQTSRYAVKINQLINDLGIQDLPRDKQFVIIRELVENFPDTSVYQAGRIVEAATRIVSTVRTRLQSVTEFVVKLSDLISPKQAKYIKKAGGGISKAIPIIGIGAGLTFFASDANAAENNWQVADAVAGNLVGLIPIIGDVWDLSYMAGTIIGEALGVDVWIANIFYDTGDEQHQENERRAAEIEAIRAAKESKKILEQSNSGEIPSEDAKEKISELKYGSQMVNVPIYIVAAGIDIYTENGVYAAEEFLDLRRERLQSLGLLTDHLNVNVDRGGFIALGDSLSGHGFSIEKFLNMVPDFNMQTAFGACFGVLGITATGSGPCDITPAEIGADPNAALPGVQSTGLGAQGVCAGMTRDDGGICDPDGIANSDYGPHPGDAPQSEPACAGVLRDDGGVCDPDGVRGSGNGEQDREGAGVTTRNTCQGMIRDDGGICDPDGVPGSENGLHEGDSSIPNLDTRSVCAGMIQDDGGVCDPDGVRGNGNGLDEGEPARPRRDYCSGVIRDDGGVCDPDGQPGSGNGDDDSRDDYQRPHICSGVIRDDGGICDPDGEAGSGNGERRDPPKEDPRDICLGIVRDDGSICDPDRTAGSGNGENGSDSIIPSSIPSSMNPTSLNLRIGLFNELGFLFSE